jgi:hypothetical protein
VGGRNFLVARNVGISYKQTVYSLAGGRVSTGPADEAILPGSGPVSKRGRGQRALYEAMSQSPPKAKRRGVLEALRPQVAKIKLPSLEQLKPSLERVKKAVTPKPKPKPTPSQRVEPVRTPTEKPAPPPVVPPKAVERPETKPPQAPRQTWLKPKAFQFNDGRIEISMPYQLGIAVVLALILVILVAFRLGQIDQRARFAATQQPGPATVPVSPIGSEQPTEAAGSSATASTSGSGPSAPAAAQGDHVIVLAQYPVRTHLEPARAYFASQGIETEIISVSALRQYFLQRGLNTAVLPDEGYMLVTSGRLYENPNDPDSDGYAVKQKIIELGAQYKAPTGYETFAPNYFSDAYPMKIK